MGPLIIIVQSILAFPEVWHDKNCANLNVVLMQVNMYSFSFGTIVFSVFILQVIYFVSKITAESTMEKEIEKNLEETDYTMNSLTHNLNFN